MIVPQIYAIRNTGDAEFAVGLADLVKKYNPAYEVIIVSAQAQKSELMKHRDKSIINLDPFTRLSFHHTIDICRSFYSAKHNSQDICYRYIPRKFTPSIRDQIKAIPPGEYMLVDDDISTGGTMDFIERLMTSPFFAEQPHFTEHCISISSRMSLLTESLKLLGYVKDHWTTYELIDVIDTHDFIPTAPTSGLVIMTSQSTSEFTARKLYTDDSVNLGTRAKISNPNFKKELLELSEQFIKRPL